jgi:hypothetical protein
MGIPVAAAAPAPDAPLQEQLEWLGTQRLAFGCEQGELRFNSDALADEIGLTVNLTCFEPRQKNQPFAHLASYLLAGDMAVSAATYVPLVASTTEYSESILEIPYFGSTCFRIEGKDWFDRAGQQAIYLPGQSFSVETGHFNGLLFNLNPKRLALTISEVSRHSVPLELAERWVQRPVAIDLVDPRVKHLQRHLESGLQNLANHHGAGPGHPEAPLAVGVETLVYRCSARMIVIALG